MFLRLNPEAGLGALLPIELGRLLHLINDKEQLCVDIEALLVRKRDAPEMGLSEPIASIDSSIEEELERLESIKPPLRFESERVPKLNALFHAILQEGT